MPVAHCYLNGSDNPAQYCADYVGRQAISVAEYFTSNVFVDNGMTLYRFDPDADVYGNDPWRIVTLDQYMPGRAPDPTKPFIVENASGTRTFDVSGDYQVFVSKRDLERAGVAVPEKTVPNPHVGKTFRDNGTGRLYLCNAYDPNRGYDMIELVPAGRETCISDNAIGYGRTFRPV